LILNERVRAMNILSIPRVLTVLGIQKDMKFKCKVLTLGLSFLLGLNLYADTNLAPDLGFNLASSLNINKQVANNGDNNPQVASVNVQGVYNQAVSSQQQKKDQATQQALERFSNSVDIVREIYVQPLTDAQILDKALVGLLTELDPHSQYLNQEEYEALSIATSGEFTGIGAEVTMEDGMIKVISPLDDSPAAKAGIEAGDLIVKINDTPVSGMKLDQAIKLIRGKSGTKLNLTIVRKNQTEPVILILVRAPITVVSVKEKLIDGHYGYIRISSFQENTAKELHKAIDNLLASTNGQLRGVILDLRNNPGGLLPVSVEVADAFLDVNASDVNTHLDGKSAQAAISDKKIRDNKNNNNIVVSTKGRMTESGYVGEITPGDDIKGIPVVALINGGSASASEIVAAALQDHHRAVIMGERSFGKGSVQSVIPLADGKTAIKITTARFYSPSGRPIQGEGVTPDVTVPALKLDTNSKQAQSSAQAMDQKISYREIDLNQALKPEHPEVVKKQDEQVAQNKIDLETQKDYQLTAAVNLLKGLYAFEGQSSGPRASHLVMGN